MQIQSNENSTSSNVKTVAAAAVASRPQSLSQKLKKNHEKHVLNAVKPEPTLVDSSGLAENESNNKNDLNKANLIRQKNKFFPFIRKDSRMHHHSADDLKTSTLENSKYTDDDVFTRTNPTADNDISQVLALNLENESKDLSEPNFDLNLDSPIVKEIKNKKQIQFNIDPSVAANNKKKADSAAKSNDSGGSLFGRRSSVHDRLNQLKVEAIRKRRLNNERKESLNKEKKLKQNSKLVTFNFKDLCKEIDSIQLRLYYFLQRPVGVKGFVYRLFTFNIILGSILMGACTTIKSLDSWSSIAFFWYEIFATIYFSIELALRSWSCIHNTKYSGDNGRLRFFKRPLTIIEMTVIFSSLVLLCFYTKLDHWPEIFRPLSLLKFIQIFRFLYVDRKGQTWTLLIDVVSKHRLELLTSGYIAVIVLLFSSYLILLVEKPYSEKNNDNHFHSYADAVYWSVITMATIGYGDRSPRTFYGKLIATVLCIIGVAFWTLPSGIIGSGFALKVGEKNKKKQFNRLVPAAATLIQSWWRMKASCFLSSSNMSSLIATVKTFDISKPIVSQSLRRLKKAIDSGNGEEMSQYFVGLDQPAVKHESNSVHIKQNGDVIHDKNIESNNLEEETLFSVGEETNRLLNIEDTLSKNDFKFVNNYLSSHSSVGHSSNEETSLMLQLSAEHLILIRTILLLKFLAAKQKFKLAFKPYDFKDVIEQYTQGNMDVLLKMKDLQRKIEKVHESLPPTRNSSNDMYFSTASSAKRSYLNQHQLNNHNLSEGLSISSGYGSAYDYQIDNHNLNHTNNNQNVTHLGTTTRRQRHRSAQILKSTSLDFGESFEDEYNLNERVESIETKLNELSTKLDKLIGILEVRSINTRNLEESPL